METTQTPLQNIRYDIKVKEVSLLKFYITNLYKEYSVHFLHF